MTERRKSFLDWRAHRGHGDDEGETEVADNGASQQAATFIIAVDIGRHVDGQVGRPRHATQKHGEAQVDLRHVESENERHRNMVREIETVRRRYVEVPIYSHSIQCAIVVVVVVVVAAAATAAVEEEEEERTD